jgi:hypothetical protein
MPSYIIKPYIVDPPAGTHTTARTTGASAAPTRWAAPPWTMVPLAPRRCLVRNPLDGASAELSSGEYAVLSACDGCRTLDEHEARAAAQLAAPSEHRPAIREVLERCARSGLLMPVSELVGRFGAPAASASQGIAAVVIRTADRPQLLARLLSSVAALEARTGSHRRWIVMDDSHDPGNERANSAALEACRTLDIEHVDRAATATLEQVLRSKFPDLDSEIGWLLGPGLPGETTAGVPINHALLRLAGRAFVNIDDDAIIDPRRPAMSEPGFAVADAADELFLYDSEAALWRDCPALDLDPLAAHEQWLGLPMADAWRLAEQQTGALATMEIASGELERFAADARVLFTHNHACGDPGSSMLPLQLFALPPRSREWLASHPHAAAYGFGSRIDWRGQTRLRLAPQRVLTFTTMVGIDNSRLLPPAARNHRNQDLLLGLIGQRMYPSSWVVDLPFGLPHLRAPAKHWLGSDEAFAQEPLHVVYFHLEERLPRLVSSSAEQRLAAMGTLLLDLAAASERRLGEALLHQAIETGGRALFLIQEQLDDATLPVAWKSALAPWLRSPALTPDAARARALEPAAVRTVLESYGRAMIAWPQLWRFCRERNV